MEKARGDVEETVQPLREQPGSRQSTRKSGRPVSMFKQFNVEVLFSVY